MLRHCQDVFLPKFSHRKNPQENAQFVILCHNYYVNLASVSLFVHNPALSGQIFVDNSVDNVENTLFSTVIWLGSPSYLPVDKAVDTGDNSRIIHNRALITSP